MQVLRHYDLGDAQGQAALHAWVDGDPLVGVGRGHGEAGVHLIQSAAVVAVASLAELAVAPHPAGRRNPGGKEIRAEGQNDVGVLQVEVGENVLLVDVFDGGAIDVVVDGLEVQMLGAEGFGEAGGQ